MFGGPGSPTQVMSTLKRRESFSWFDGASGRFQRLRRKMRSHSVDGYDYSPPVSPTSKSGESDALTVNLCFVTPDTTHCCWIDYFSQASLFTICCNIPHHIAHYLVLHYMVLHHSLCFQELYDFERPLSGLNLFWIHIYSLTPPP